MANVNNSSQGRYWLGIVLIVLGAFFIADNFDLLPYHFMDFVFQWEFILIIVGTVILFNSKDAFFGLVLIGIGALFLLSDVFDYSVGRMIRDYWPIGLILLGLYIIIKRGGSNKFETSEKQNLNDPNYDGDNRKQTNTYNIDMIDSFEIFSGASKKINSNNFRGGKITSIMAGPEFDFTDSILAEGTNILDITAIFGGIELVVPNEWNVIINVTAIFGGVDDKRKYISKSDGQSKGTLIIKGLVLFGGGEIKN
jgi:predicted membrane protein